MSALFQWRQQPAPVRATGHPLQAQAPIIEGAELAASYYTQRQGGDFYDFFRVSPTRVLFGLLDLAGRIEEARAILSTAQQVFRNLSSELFASEEVNEADAMVQIAIQLNRSILAAEEGIHPCPAFAGCYNQEVGTICYFNAGHTPGLLRDDEGVTQLPATGLPLGLFSHATSDAPTVALEACAALLLVSRGVVEAKCGHEEFGLERVSRGLAEFSSSSAQQLCATVLDQVQQFMCARPIHNDVSALALLRAAAAKAAISGQP